MYVYMGSGSGVRSLATCFRWSLTVWVWFGASAMITPPGSAQPAMVKTKHRVKLYDTPSLIVRAIIQPCLCLHQCVAFHIGGILKMICITAVLVTFDILKHQITKRISKHRLISGTFTSMRTSAGTLSQDTQISKPHPTTVNFSSPSPTAD